jgi:type III secretion system low calcium response chaperone LcrH/SycD
MAKEEKGKISDIKIYETMAKITEDAAPEIQKGVESFLDSVLKKGMSPKDALGLKDEMLEGLYAQAYHLFNNGKYKDATTIFRLLILLDALEAKYSMGLAACLHMMKEYAGAAQVYAMAGVLDMANPLPYYHASDCWIKLGDTEAALNSLEMVILRSQDIPQFKTLQDRCTMTMEGLKKSALKKDENAK